MEFIATTLSGLWKILTPRVADERGWFVRTLDLAVLASHGLETLWPEAGEAHNLRAGTLRGLHFQRPPHAEAKLIRCTRGAVYDVLLDARRDSPSYGRWEAFELREDDGVMLYAPPGLAHGYQTLTDASTMAYLHSTPYRADSAAGFRYDSPTPAIPWPREPVAVSARDRALPPFEPGASRIDPQLGDR
jgi:dTDP-4-dehydrorhamnose 3,5-epimerase